MLGSDAAVALDAGTLFSEHERLDGRSVLTRFLDVSAHYVRQLRTLQLAGTLPERVALIGRVRGTGPGVSFSRLVTALRDAYPLPLESPFEDSKSVAGAVLDPRVLLHADRDDALLVLQFDSQSTELPMHSHEDSDRLLYVIGGRGFFHVSDEAVASFSGHSLRTVAVRERDIVLFSRNTVHTFSTASESLHLLSYHAPFVFLDDVRQYTLPACRRCPGRENKEKSAEVICDAAWNRVT